MKKLLLVLAAALICANASGQFVLTPAGFVNKDNPDLDYYVLEFPGKSKAQLYRSAVAYLTVKYSSPNDVFSFVENEMISLNGFGYNAVLTSRGIFGGAMDVWFNVQVEFRDGRIRIMRPVVRNITRLNRTTKEVKEKHEKKDKDGKVISTEERTREVPVTITSVMYISPYYLDGDERAGFGDTVIFNKKNKLKHPVAKETLEDYFNTMVYGLFRSLSGGEDW